MPEYLSLGKVFDTHGLDGTLRVSSTTYFAKDRYKVGASLMLVSPDGANRKPVTVRKFRSSGSVDFVNFEELDNPEEAILYKGWFVEIEKADAVLPKGTYLFSDLEKCLVIDQDGNGIGKVLKVEEFPAQLTLRIKKPDGKTFFVPFIKEFIQEVDIKQHVIKIKVIGGML